MTDRRERALFHIKCAETLLEATKAPRKVSLARVDDTLAEAQVHATLALAEATLARPLRP